MLAPWKKSYDKPRQHIKKQRHHSADRGPNSLSYRFPSIMYGCESWTVKKVEHKELMLLNRGAGKTLESPLDCKEIKPVSPKGNQPQIFIGRTDAEAEAPILRPAHVKN